MSLPLKSSFRPSPPLVVERVPAPDLATAARVSREWLRTVHAALRRRPRRLPWLVAHV
jgi:hypothetical protein